MPFETDINSGDVYSKQVWNHLKIKREPSRQLQNKFQLKISFHIEFNTNHSDHPDSTVLRKHSFGHFVGFLSPLSIFENHSHFVKEFGL